MLVRFEATNFRSLSETVELTMVAIDNERDAAREAPHLGVSLLTVASIYGPNASGKTNVLAALAWLREAVRNSETMWIDAVPVEPFAFGNGPDRDTEFVLESTIDGVRFEYVLEVSQDGISYEALFHYPEKKRRRIFERDGQDLKLQRGLGHLSGIRETLTERALVLTIARRYKDPLVAAFASDLLRAQVLGPVPMPELGRDPIHPSRRNSTIDWFHDSDQPTLFDQPDQADLVVSKKNQALSLLQLADLGIEDVVVEREVVGDPTTSGSIRTKRKMRLLHRVSEDLVPMDYASESEGTKTWFRLIGPILSALNSGSVMLFDEIDSSLHPTLSAELIKLFQNPVTNPKGAQLILSTHDTSLLNHLNRDEVWLTEKQVTGGTRLGALADFAGERVRKSVNLENAYLHGRFGATPQLDLTNLLRSLRLIG